MTRPRPERSTCWDEPWHPVVLTRDPEAYGLLADALDAAAPAEWASVRASLVLGGSRGRICSVGPMCGSTTEADDACIRAIHDAIMAFGSRCLSPAGMEWVGLWIEHDFTTGVMVARMIHGGLRRAARPSGHGIPRILAHPATSQ